MGKEINSTNMNLHGHQKSVPEKELTIKIGDINSIHINDINVAESNQRKIL